MKASPKSIIFIHLLNDFSGSPLVLSQVIEAYQASEYHRVLFTSRSAPAGFLSDLPGVETHFFWYRWQKNPWLRLVTFTLSQVLLFFQLMRYRKTDAVFYVNTLLPFGAALAAKVMGKKVIYHLHESSINPPALKSFLRSVANNTAGVAVHVSQFLLEKEALKKANNILIYNCLPKKFTQSVQPLPDKEPFTILMICSLKTYKGVWEFVELAKTMHHLSFELLLNAGETEIHDFFQGKDLPANLRIFPATRDVHPFYRRAALLLNLSHPGRWVETFGMTVLEAMVYGVPAIVPPVGGITELVDDGQNGYQIDVRQTDRLLKAIEQLANDKDLHLRFSVVGLTKSKQFGINEFQKSILEKIPILD